MEDYYDGLISINNFNSYCENQLDSALNLNSETDAKIVGFGFSVAKNSVNYWENNLDKWNDLFDEFEDTPLSTTNDKLASDDTAEVGDPARSAVVALVTGLLFLI